MRKAIVHVLYWIIDRCCEILDVVDVLDEDEYHTWTRGEGE